MAMEIRFPAGVAADAVYKGHVIHTDQSERAGGRDAAPEPFDLFLASIGTCAGYYALAFCRGRGIDTEGMRLLLEPVRSGEPGRLATIRLTLELPEGFPEKYHRAIVRSMDQCTVKRHVLDPPAFEVEAVRVGAASSS